MILTLFFLFALGSSKEYPSWEDASGIEVFNTMGGELFKVVFFIIVLVGGGMLVNFGADTEFAKSLVKNSKKCLRDLENGAVIKHVICALSAFFKQKWRPEYRQNAYGI